MVEFRELSLAQLVRLLLWNLSTGIKSSTWNGGSHFFEFILGFNALCFQVVGDVPVDNETPVMISSISKSVNAVKIIMCLKENEINMI